LAKQLIAQHYGKPAAYSYFSGCSTGGREGMILSQRYPTAFNGIISGDPAMRTGLSNLAIGRWIPIAFNQVAPKDANGKPIIAKSITDDDRKLIKDALLKRCDAKDGLADGLISDPLACDFDPEMLACTSEKKDSCLAPEKAAAIKKAMGGPKTATGTQVYAGFLFMTQASRTVRRSEDYSRPVPAFSGPRQRTCRWMSIRKLWRTSNRSWTQCPPT